MYEDSHSAEIEAIHHIYDDIWWSVCTDPHSALIEAIVCFKIQAEIKYTIVCLWRSLLREIQSNVYAFAEQKKIQNKYTKKNESFFFFSITQAQSRVPHEKLSLLRVKKIICLKINNFKSIMFYEITFFSPNNSWSIKVSTFSFLVCLSSC